MEAEKLKQLAVDIYDGKVFTNLQLKDNKDIPIVFLPVMFGGLKNYPLHEIGMIYEYIDQAGPRSINGYPIFSSMRMIKKDQMETLDKYYQEYKTLKESFLK